MTREEALEMAVGVLDGKTSSHVGAARHLARHVVETERELDRLRRVIRTGGAMYRAERSAMGIPGMQGEEWCVICKREPQDHTDVEYRAHMAACGKYDGGEHPSLEAVAKHRAQLEAIPVAPVQPAKKSVGDRVSEEAEIAYLAFCRSRGFPVKDWESLLSAERRAWGAVAIELHGFKAR